MKIGLRNAVGGYREYAAPADLGGVSDAIWIHEVPRGRPVVTHRVLPDPGVGLAFSCHRDPDGRVGGPQLVLLGPIVTPRPFTVHAGYEMAAVKIHIECARRLLDLSPGDHVDAITPFDMLRPRQYGPLFDALCATRSVREVVMILSAFVARLADAAPPGAHDSTRHALALIRRTAGRAPVEAVARELGIPERTLRRRIMEDADMSPKAYARTVRFLHALALADRSLGHATGPDWADVAAAAGYFDQSHLVREFQAFSGMTPGEVYLERRREPAVPAFPLLRLEAAEPTR